MLERLRLGIRGWSFTWRLTLIFVIPLALVAILLSHLVNGEIRKLSLGLEAQLLEQEAIWLGQEIRAMGAMRDQTLVPGQEFPCLDTASLSTSEESANRTGFSFEEPVCAGNELSVIPILNETCFYNACEAQMSLGRGETKVLARILPMGQSGCGAEEATGLPGPNGCLIVWRALDQHENRLAGPLLLPIIALATGAFATGLIVFLLSRRFGNRIQRINSAFESFASGDRQVRAPTFQYDEDLNSLAESANLALRQIEQDMISARRVSASLSHQLLAPIKRMQARVSETVMEMAASTGPETHDTDARLKTWREELEGVSRDADGVFSMGQSLLALLSASGDTQAARQKDIVDLDEVCMLCAARFRKRAAESGIEIRVDAAGVEVVSVYHSIDQIVSNLIDNAIKYGPPSGKISITCDETETEAWLAVQDEGNGPPEDVLRDVFDDHVLVSATNSATEGRGGHGIGLLTVRQLADNSNIRLEQRQYHPGWAVVLSWPVRSGPRSKS